MPDTIDQQEFRDILGHYPTGVSVVTALASDGQAVAMVVGTFTSVSLDPPLVAFLPTKTSSSFAELRDAQRWVVNILAHDQEDIVRRLARSDRTKMDAEKWTPSETGTPIVDGVVAMIECTTHSITDAGDHFIVLGAVESLRTVRPTMPLLFFRGGYGEFAPRSFVVPDGRGMSGAVAQAQVLRGDLERASEALNGELTVFARIAGDSVAVATAAAPGGDQITPLGTRYPLAPPIGAQYVTWSDERDQQLWIDRAVGATREELAALREHLADAREWGWSVSLIPDDASDWPTEFAQVEGLEELLRDRHAEVTRRMMRAARPYDIGALQPDESYRVIGLMAPIFVAEGAPPELMARLLLYPAQRMSRAELIARGEQVKAFAEDAAAALRGALAGASR